MLNPLIPPLAEPAKIAVATNATPDKDVMAQLEAKFQVATERIAQQEAIIFHLQQRLSQRAESPAGSADESTQLKAELRDWQLRYDQLKFTCDERENTLEQLSIQLRDMPALQTQLQRSSALNKQLATQLQNVQTLYEESHRMVEQYQNVMQQLKQELHDSQMQFNQAQRRAEQHKLAVSQLLKQQRELQTQLEATQQLLKQQESTIIELKLHHDSRPKD